MLELVLRVVFSLAVVLGLLWLIARVSSRRLRGSAHQGLVRTLVRQPLSRGSSLAVVSVGERVLVVGVTEHQVSLLTELDPDEVTSTAEDPTAARHDHASPVTGRALGGSVLSTQTWKQALAAATKRNGGRP